MGKGDSKTARGKRYRGSYGNARSHDTETCLDDAAKAGKTARLARVAKAPAKTAAKTAGKTASKKVTAKKVAAKKVAKKATKKAAAKKTES